MGNVFTNLGEWVLYWSGGPFALSSLKNGKFIVIYSLFNFLTLLWSTSVNLLRLLLIISEPICHLKKWKWYLWVKHHKQFTYSDHLYSLSLRRIYAFISFTLYTCINLIVTAFISNCYIALLLSMMIICDQITNKC